MHNCLCIYRKRHIKTMRPMLPLAACASVGLWLASLEKGLYPALAGGLLLTAACQVFLDFRLPCLKWLLPLVYAAACGQMLLIFLPGASLGAAADGDPIVIRGKIISLPDNRSGTSQVIVRLDSLARVALRAPSGQLAYGARIEATVLLDKPEEARNPGGFSEADWLRQQGVSYKAAPVPGEKVRIISAPGRFCPVSWAAGQREQLGLLLQVMTGEETAGLISALLLGDRTYLTLRQREIFRRAGIAHLAAVSGTHLAMLIWPLERLLRPLFRRKTGRSAVVLLIILFYCTVAGWPLSMTRSVFMFAAVFLGRVFSRQADYLNSLGLAALVMLLFRPLSVLSPGFWMSVLATASLIIWARPLAKFLRGRLAWLPRWLALAVSAGICAQMAVLPLAAGISGEVTFISLIGTVLAAPLLQALLLLGFLIIPLAAVLNWLSVVSPEQLRLLALPLIQAARLFFILAERLAVTFVGRWQAGRVNFSVWIWFYSWPVAWSGLFGRLTGILRLDRFRAGRLLFAGRCLAAFAAILVLLLTIWLRPPFQVWFLDVGQGDAILIRSREGRTILIDGGRSGSGYRVLLPALDSLGISRVDLAIATHGHDDHLGGINDLLAMRRIRNLVLPLGLVYQDAGQADAWRVVRTEDNSTDALVAAALALAENFGVKVQTWHSNDTINLNSSSRLQVLHPGGDPDMSLARRDGNALSLVIMAEACGYRLLLTGDCTGQSEAWLLGEGRDLAADMLKVAHHGSGYSSGEQFLREVGPEVAIICVGSNPYGHPAPQVLERLADLGCAVWRTDEAGAITWLVRPGGWTLKAKLQPEK